MTDEAESEDQDHEEELLVARLRELQLQEAALRKQRHMQQLKDSIAKTESRLAALASTELPSSPTAMFEQMPYTASQAAAKTSLDDLLTGAKVSLHQNTGQRAGQNTATPSFLMGPGLAPDGPLLPPEAVQESLMFLKPAQVNKGERVLRIIDFIEKLVPNSEEHTISEVGSTRLLVSFGSKKPKLESVSLAQWVIGNTRIFHTLLQLGRLLSQADVQHYLAYTVKIMELSTRFSWASVLKHDDEFRHLQATYNYPWSYDSPHLHTVLLEPISASSQTKFLSPPKSNSNNGSVSTVSGNLTPEGKVLCRNYNRIKGCILRDCSFVHACNRKINGRACAQLHPFYNHQGTPKSGTSTPTPPGGSQ